MTQPIHRFIHDPLQEPLLWNEIRAFLETDEQNDALYALSAAESDPVKWLRAVDVTKTVFDAALQVNSLSTVRQIHPTPKIRSSSFALVRSSEMLRLLSRLRPKVTHSPHFLARAISLSAVKLIRDTAPSLLEWVANPNNRASQLFKRQALYACIMYGDEEIVPRVIKVIQDRIIDQDSPFLLLNAVFNRTNCGSQTILEALLSASLYQADRGTLKSQLIGGAARSVHSETFGIVRFLASHSLFLPTSWESLKPLIEGLIESNHPECVEMISFLIRKVWGGSAQENRKMCLAAQKLLSTPAVPQRLAKFHLFVQHGAAKEEGDRATLLSLIQNSDSEDKVEMEATLAEKPSHCPIL